MRTVHLERENENQSLIVINKDDEVEDSFCYKLFELGEFDVAKIQELVSYVSLNVLNNNEKNVPTPQSQAKQQAWFPSAHGDCQRSSRFGFSSCQRP